MELILPLNADHTITALEAFKRHFEILEKLNDIGFSDLTEEESKKYSTALFTELFAAYKKTFLFKAKSPIHPDHRQSTLLSGTQCLASLDHQSDPGHEADQP
jgi:hypothetical protein